MTALRASILVLAALAATTFTASAQDPWERARDAAGESLARFRDQSDREIEALRAEVAALRRTLLETAGRATEAEADAALLAARLDDATRARDAAAGELEQARSEIGAAAAAIDERTATMPRPADSRPAPDALQAALEAIESRLRDAGRIRIEGRLIRAGELQWIEVLPEEHAVFGKPGRASPVGPIAVPGIASVAQALARGEPPPFIPIDPTGRLDLRPPATGRDLSGWLQAGGPIVIVIVLVGGLGLLVAIWRMALLFREPGPHAPDVGRAREAVLAGDREGAARVLRGRRGAVHAALAEVALVAGPGQTAGAEGRIEQILLRTVESFERFLHVIAVLAAVSPLLGLLGTVTGMIRMFDALGAGATGSSHVEALSGGIGEALITTEAGLLFAIPLVLLHALISARADRLEAGLEDAAIEVAGKPEAA